MIPMRILESINRLTSSYKPYNLATFSSGHPDRSGIDREQNVNFLVVPIFGFRVCLVCLVPGKKNECRTTTNEKNKPLSGITPFSDLLFVPVRCALPVS
jgi:hypothetical protein